MQWTGPAADRLLTRPLDSLTAVFDRLSGQTHLLAAPLPEILDVLGDGPADAPTVLARLAARYTMDAEAEAAALLDERLHELAALGLITPGLITQGLR